MSLKTQRGAEGGGGAYFGGSHGGEGARVTGRGGHLQGVEGVRGCKGLAKSQKIGHALGN